MAMNPMQLMQLAERLRIFKSQHPKVLDFMHDVVRNDLQPGVVMELRVTDNDGKTSVTNIRLTEEDVETIGILKEPRGDNFIEFKEYHTNQKGLRLRSPFYVCCYCIAPSLPNVYVLPSIVRVPVTVAPVSGSRSYHASFSGTHSHPVCI